MDEPTRQAAMALLHSAELTKQIQDDLEKAGVVGEEGNKLLLYLVATSRKLNRPLSGIIHSASSSGKSHLAECVARLIPKEEAIYLSRLSPAALYYLPEGALKHKLLIVEERIGAETSDYALRLLQSQGALIQAIPVKAKGTGDLTTVFVSVEGPVSILETTTRSVQEENLSRCFEITLDESEAQTQRIHAVQRRTRTLTGLKEAVQRAALQAKHHAAQRLLKALEVVIPFAPLIRFPAHTVRMRREHARFLGLIEASALLHQYQRRRCRISDDREAIEAALSDYEVAYRLMQPFLQRASRPNLSLHVRELSDMLRQRPDPARPFTLRECRQGLGWPKHQAQRAVGELIAAGLGRVKESGRGRRSLYQWISGDPGTRDVALLAPEELEREWNKQRRQK